MRRRSADVSIASPAAEPSAEGSQTVAEAAWKRPGETSVDALPPMEPPAEPSAAWRRRETACVVARRLPRSRPPRQAADGCRIGRRRAGDDRCLAARQVGRPRASASQTAPRRRQAFRTRMARPKRRSAADRPRDTAPAGIRTPSGERRRRAGRPNSRQAPKPASPKRHSRQPPPAGGPTQRFDRPRRERATARPMQGGDQRQERQERHQERRQDNATRSPRESARSEFAFRQACGAEGPARGRRQGAALVLIEVLTAGSPRLGTRHDPEKQPAFRNDHARTWETTAAGDRQRIDRWLGMPAWCARARPRRLWRRRPCPGQRRAHRCAGPHGAGGRRDHRRARSQPSGC